ncbi:MAG: hypothetical protein ACYTGX_10260 [Planctomycetota bacterium]|jgi:hypothetical protein
MADTPIDIIAQQLEGAGWTIERQVTHTSDAAERWRLSCDGGVCYLESFGDPVSMVSVCTDPDDPHTQMAVMLAIGDDFDERLPNFVKGCDRFRA